MRCFDVFFPHLPGEALLDFMSDARLLALVLLLPRPSSSFLLLAGSHLPALDRSGPRRTSTGEIRRAVGLAGLQPARFGAPRAGL